MPIYRLCLIAGLSTLVLVSDVRGADESLATRAAETLTLPADTDARDLGPTLDAPVTGFDPRESLVPVAGDFPPLPPPPSDLDQADLPPLSDELWNHGGSYLYQPEGDRWNWPQDGQADHYRLRLPEDWRAPQPWTAWSKFLGADPVQPVLPPSWLSPEYAWDRRFTAFGSYALFAFAQQQARQRRDAVGHQVFADLDLRLTGTERFHVQFRPVGRRGTGGSYYQFNDPAGYRDNSTGEPDRYWFEGELHSLVGFSRDPLASRYLNFVVGKFPFATHNSLLINDDILGFVVSKNNLYLGRLSNLNLQLWTGLDDVDTYADVRSQVYGVHASLDRQKAFYELTYAFVRAGLGRSAHFAAASRTKTYGPVSFAARALLKFGDQGGTGSAQLLALESNYTVIHDSRPLGIEHAVCFCNAFWASEGWNSIGGGNFNRLRTAFVVNPLVRLAAGPATDDVCGVAVGVQLFRHHEDESLIPEIAWEAPAGRTVIGFGLRYLRKTGPRTFFELLGIVNESEDPQFDRDGVFVTHSWVF